MVLVLLPGSSRIGCFAGHGQRPEALRRVPRLPCAREGGEGEHRAGPARRVRAQGWERRGLPLLPRDEAQRHRLDPRGAGLVCRRPAEGGAAEPHALRRHGRCARPRGPDRLHERGFQMSKRRTFDRRHFLLASGALVALSAAPRRSRGQPAGTLRVPTVDELAVRIVTDSSYDTPRAMSHKLVKVRRESFTKAPSTRTLHSEWGLATVLRSSIGADTRQLQLDFGYTPDTLLNNLEFLGVDISKTQGLVM